MSFGNVTLPLLCQIDITFQVGARKLAHQGSPFNIKSRTLSRSPRWVGCERGPLLAFSPSAA
jgi:hypothetical protein